METAVSIIALFALGAWVNFRGYYLIKTQVSYIGWLSPLLFAIANLFLMVRNFRTGPVGSVSFVLLSVTFSVLALASLASIAAGYKNRRHKKTSGVPDQRQDPSDKPSDMR